MSSFEYISVDTHGKRREGVVEAMSHEEAAQAVRKMGNRIISVRPAKAKTKRFKLSEINITAPKVKTSLKVIFFRELATLINAGIQLDDALTILKLQIEDKRFSKVVMDVAEMVKSGRAFSEALGDHPRVFRQLVVSLVRAAEAGGGLGNILNQIAFYIEKAETTRKKLKAATSYPKFIFGFFFLVLAGVVFGLLPKFKDIYSSFGAELPPSTTVILAISDFIRNHLITEIAFIAVIVTGFTLFKKSARGTRFIDQHIFSVPIAGGIIHKTMLTHMSHTLSVLLKSGVSLIRALKIAGETADNVYVDEVMNEVGKGVSHGKNLSGQLALYPDLFPTMVSSMVGVGEKSGALALMLEKIAEFNDRDLNSKVEGLSSTMEPMLMGGLGLVVCIIVVTLYLPIFQMTGAIH